MGALGFIVSLEARRLAEIWVPMILGMVVVKRKCVAVTSAQRSLGNEHHFHTSEKPALNLIGPPVHQASDPSLRTPAPQVYGHERAL